MIFWFIDGLSRIISWLSLTSNLANIYLFKVNNRNTKKSEICSKLTLKIPEQRRRPAVFDAKVEHISHIFLIFLLLTWIINVQQSSYTLTWEQGD